MPHITLGVLRSNDFCVPTECNHDKKCFFLYRLGSVCSHAAALLFKLQACAQLELNKVACTSKLCSWKKSRRHAAAAPLKNIDFSRPKKSGLLPIPSLGTDQLEKPFSSPDPKKCTNTKIKLKLKELKKIAPKAAIFTSIESSSEEEMDSSGTDTADEDDLNSIPEPLTSLFHSQAINYSKDELNAVSQKMYKKYQISQTKTQYKNLCNITKIQSMSRTWKLHRAGRITASISKQAFVSKTDEYPMSLMNTVMQYSSEVSVAATKYGKEMEPLAKKGTQLWSLKPIKIYWYQTQVSMLFKKCLS